MLDLVVPRPGVASIIPMMRNSGLQGAALILELRRLQHAFEAEGWKDQLGLAASARHGSRREAPLRTGSRKRRRKNRVGRSIDVWLERLRLKQAHLVQRRSIAFVEPAGPQAGGRGPSFAPEHPEAIDLITLGPEMHVSGDASVSIEPDKSGLNLPRPAPAETKLRRLIDKGGVALRSAVTFVCTGTPASQGDAAEVSMITRVKSAFENELRTGFRVLIGTLLAVCCLGLMPLAGAVVVPGNLVVESNVKAIQHPTGGIVAEITVMNGARVNAGDLLVRLDFTQTLANFQMVSKQLDELRARIARLVAERDGLDQIHIPPELASRGSENSARSFVASENALLKARSNARESQKDLLQNRVKQLTEEIAGLDAQLASKAKQLELVAGELTGVQDLYDKRLVPLTRLTTLQRETARIEGERGQLISAVAETKSKIGESQLQLIRIDQEFRSDVVKELGEAQGKEAELAERRVAARDQLNRIEIRAPTAGIIHQLSVHTIGGVIRAGDTIMEIVPDEDVLQIEVRLQPTEIDHVRTGQEAFVRFSAFNQRTTPQITGTVSYISADTSHDQQSNASYYLVRVSLSDHQRHRLSGLQLVPGMPAEVFMQTTSRTLLSYLLKPITDQMQRAFVEQ